MMATNAQESSLHTPLLGVENYFDEQQESISQQQHQEKLAVSSSVTYGDEDNDLDDDDDYILRYECIIFPFLLLVQFGMAFLRNDIKNDGNNGAPLSWGTVTCAIFVLTATIWLYRGACADVSKLNDQHQYQYYSYFTILVFLPEIIINIILVLAMFDMITMAYATILLGGLLLGFIGIVATIHFIMYNNSKGQREQDEKEVHDESRVNDNSKQVDALLIL